MAASGISGISMDGIAMLSPDLQRAFSAAVTAEKKPIQNITTQKANVDAKVELLKDVLGKVEGVRSLLPNLETPFAIRELKVASSNEGVLSGTADKRSAEPGTHNLEILQLATPASALSNGFEDKDSTRVGSGYFTFNTASGETKEVYIDNETGTLEGMARAINSARVGVKASVVNDQTDPELPYRLVLTAEGSGKGNNVEFPEFYFIDGESDFYIEKEKPANNAMLRYQGNDIEVASNTVNDLIPGVTVNLKGVTDPGHPISLTVDQDVPKTTVKMKDMVDKLNQVFTFIQNQNKMDEKTDTSKTLGGDYGIRVSEDRIRQALNQNFIGDPSRKIQTLSDLGIQFTKTGTLSFDEKKFEAQLNGRFDEVVDFLTGDGQTYGIVPRLGRALTSIAAPEGGVLANQKRTEMNKSERLQQDIDKKDKASAQKLEDLKQKLARTQTAITQIQRQGASLQAMGGGNGSMSSMVGQLVGF